MRLVIVLKLPLRPSSCNCLVARIENRMKIFSRYDFSFLITRFLIVSLEHFEVMMPVGLSTINAAGRARLVIETERDLCILCK